MTKPAILWCYNEVTEMKLDFLWDEEKTRKLFRTHLILFLIGGIVATCYTLLLPATIPYRLVVIAVPAIFTLSTALYLLLLSKPNVGLRFLLFTLESQLAATIFMAVTGGFLGIVQFAPFMFLLFAVFELGVQSTLILGTFSVLTFIGLLFWNLTKGLEVNTFQHFFYYVGSYILIVVIEHNIGRELSLQFEAKKKLEQIDDIKNQFITLTSHYLRTPLTVIKGFMSGMKLPQLTDIQKQDMQRINVAVEELENMIEKLLVISSIEKGQTRVTLIPADINNMLSGIITQFQPLAASLKVNLSFQPVPMPRFAFDSIKIKEVVSSLLDNAIKYNKPGGTAKISTGIQNNQAVIQVADSGIGIKKDELPTLFSTFSRGNMQKALSFDKPGMGLSLYIARLVIEGHKGKISVTSLEGQGSVFTISLPLK